VDPELTGELGQIWEAAWPFAETGQVVCIRSESGPFLMLAKQLGGWGVLRVDSLSHTLKDASWELVGSHKVFHEAVPERVPGPNAAPWDTYQPERPAHWSEENPKLYRLSHYTFEQLAEAVLQSTFDSIRILELQDGKVIGSKHYPAWWQELGPKRREFFKQRGINSGRSYCTCLNEEALGLILDLPSMSSEDIAGRVYPDWDHHLSQCGSNALFFLGSEGHYSFEIGLTADDAGEGEVFEAIEALLDLIFSGVEQSLEYELFEDFLEEKYGVPRAKTQEKLSGIGELFFGHDERFVSDKHWWITPDQVLVRVRHRRIDPSFGTLVESGVQNFLESRANWQRTDFRNVEVGRYLMRLGKQFADHSEID
jgi:hypothetical protein